MALKFHSNPSASYDICVKGIVIGESGSGKSSLLYRFTDNDWNPHYVATIGVDFKVLTFERQSKIVKFQLWDTAGQDRFRAITQAYYRGTHCIMIVYDIANRETFDRITKWLEDVKKYSSPGVPIVLVGNKCDLEQYRQVQRTEGEQLASSLKCQFFETSAKDNKHVDEAFELVVRNCVEKRLGDIAQQQTLPAGNNKTVNFRNTRSKPLDNTRCFCA